MEWTARQDLKHRVWTLRASIERYLQLEQAQIASIIASRPGPSGYTQDQQKLNSEKDSQMEVLLNNANNLRRALRSKHLPAAMSGRSLGTLDAPIRHVRNIREHWDENRQFWSEATVIPPGPKYASARWFKSQFPDKTPWSSGWSNVDGSIVCGIIHLGELSAILVQLEELAQLQ